MAGDDGDFPPLLNLTNSEEKKRLADLDHRITTAKTKLEEIRKQAFADWSADPAALGDPSAEPLPAGHRFQLDSAVWKKLSLKDKEKGAATEEKNPPEEKKKAIGPRWYLDGNAAAIAAESPKFVDSLSTASTARQCKFRGNTVSCRSQALD